MIAYDIKKCANCDYRGHGSIDGEYLCKVHFYQEYDRLDEIQQRAEYEQWGDKDWFIEGCPALVKKFNRGIVRQLDLFS